MKKICVTILFIFLFSLQLFGGIIRVPEHQPSIKAAVMAAETGDVVLVSDGVYTGPDNTEITWWSKQLWVRSENGPENCIIDCEGTARAFVFDFAGQTARFVYRASAIDGFTIRNGYNDEQNGGGGAIFMDEGYPNDPENILHPVIINNIFENNYSASYGGAIYYNYGLAVEAPREYCSIENNIFRNNTATYGGAIAIQYSELKILNNTFENNSSISGGSGGAIYIYNGSITDLYSEVSYNTFDGNTAIDTQVDGTGGALYIAGMAGGEVFNNRFFNNEASSGGGAVFCANSYFVFFNNLIYKNTCTNRGAGLCIYNYDGCLVGSNTIADNIGPGITISPYIGDVDSYIINNIIWGNTSSVTWTYNQSQALPTFHYNDIEGGVPAFGNDAGGNIDTDPMFGRNEMIIYRLREGSPCFNSAYAAGACPSNDLVDNPRPLGAGYDLGCYEADDDGDFVEALVLPVDDLGEHAYPVMDVTIQFVEAHAATDLDMFELFEEPTIVGNLPGTVQNLGDISWIIESSSGDVGEYELTLDLSDVRGISNFNTLHILKRADDSSPWQDVVSDLGGTLEYNNPYITIRGLSSFSEFVPGGGEDNSLPVTLSSFNAVVTDDNFAEINWSTQSESELSGFNIYRNTCENLREAECVTSNIVPATNSSTVREYSITDIDVEKGEVYSYWLETVENNGNSHFNGPVKVTIGTGKKNDVEDICKVTELMPAYPNPFNPETKIQLSIKEGENGILEIFNIKGQTVKTYDNLIEGEHTLTWNGTDNAGSSVASGVYFYRLSTQTINETKKLMLLK